MDVEEGDLSSVVFARRSGRSPPGGSITRMDFLPASSRCPPAPLYNTATTSTSASAAAFQNISLPSTMASPLPFNPCRTSSLLLPPDRIPLLPDFINHSTRPHSSSSYGANSSYPFFVPTTAVTGTTTTKAYYKERGLADMPSVVLPRIVKEKVDLSIPTPAFGIEESPLLLSAQSNANPNKRNSFTTHKKSQGSSKRRKEQQKRIVCVPSCGNGRPTGEFLPSDMWSWRKYGQKPIKGSPYPRSYYRCSSSKGCPARKQVERSRNDSGMLLITYMSEHNHPWPTHRNALAGSSSKPTTLLQDGTLTSDAADVAEPDGDHSGTNPAEDGLPNEIETDDADSSINNNNNNDDDNNCNNIEMELQMLKYATEHLWGDDDLFTDLDGFRTH